MIDLPAAASPILVNVKRASLHGGDERGRQIDFVFHRLMVICELQLRMLTTSGISRHQSRTTLNRSRSQAGSAMILTATDISSERANSNASKFFESVTRFR